MSSQIEASLMIRSVQSKHKDKHLRERDQILNNEKNML
jgi:hypothetical protein